jgi:fructokinase
MKEKEKLPMIAAIEAGGTKFICGVGRQPGELLDVTTIETTTPDETLERLYRWLMRMKVDHGAIQAIGLACFGPLNLDKSSEAYGSITTTPKRGWQHIDIVTRIRQKLRVPVGFDTDVNAAVLAEYLWGAGHDKDPVVYMTVGTGVGAGVLVNGRLLHGLLHPEIGHMSVPAPLKSEAINKDCQCPFHQSCLEGYVSGTAISKRWGMKAEKIPTKHPAWNEVAETIAHALLNLTLTVSPRRIILGGGVMQREHILPLIRKSFSHHLNGYLVAPEFAKRVHHYIVSPGLEDRSGLLGALALGKMALAEQD